MNKLNIGDLLARLAIDGARLGTVSPEQARMCSDCALKKGTPANGEILTAERARLPDE